MGFRSFTSHRPTQTNFSTGGQIRTKIMPAHFGVSRFIGLGAVGVLFFDFAFKTYMAYNTLPSTTVQACYTKKDNSVIIHECEGAETIKVEN
jgi:hypothetical protein